ncbi:18174_t:CDS:1, partial [Gigaspora rosea]
LSLKDILKMKIEIQNWKKNIKKNWKTYEKDIWTKFEKEIIFIKYNEPIISAEKIRKMIMDNDEKWKELYSSEMIEYIEKIRF